MGGKSCFFIGHREASEEIYPSLYAAVEQHILEYGITEIIVGYYGGFDRLAASAVKEAKRFYPEVNPDMMQRALHNLLGNAMHHIGEDGIFVLRALRCPEGVRVEVEDHGPGISAEDLPYIFDRYYRSRSDAGKQGTGLGLSITKAIFQQHGFRFGVHSTVGKGTVFWFIMTDTEDATAQ